MANTPNKSNSDPKRVERISKCYDCIPPDIPTKVVFPGGWEIPRYIDVNEIQSFKIEVTLSWTRNVVE